MFYSNECLTLFLDKPETLTNKRWHYLTAVLWPPEKRFLPQKYFLFFFFRLTLCKDNKSCLSTFDTQTSVTSVTPLDGIVKGVASFR